MVSFVRIEGLDKLQETLRSLPEQIETKIVRGALMAGQRIIRDEARSLVPEYQGDLKKSIRVRFDRKSLKKGWAKAHLIAGNKKAWYSHLVEFGTASHYTGTGRTVGDSYVIKAKKSKGLFFGGVNRQQVVHHGIKPQPFMRPAIDKASQLAFEAAAGHIRKRLPIELKKQGG